MRKKERERGKTLLDVAESDATSKSWMRVS